LIAQINDAFNLDSFGTSRSNLRYIMKNNFIKTAVKQKNKILILLILASHLASFGLHDLIHDHPILTSGSFEARLFPHEDADHCKHIPLSEHSECGICLSSQSRIAPDLISLDFGGVQVVGTLPIITFPHLIQNHLFSSFSRRGPPAFLG
jgi:hypothetical protein